MIEARKILEGDKMIILKGEITDLNNEERIFSGWGSVQVVDRQGDIIPISEFKPVMEKLMKRGASVIDTHTNHVVGKIINYEFKKTSDGKDGLYLTAKIFNDYPSDNEVWQGILNGEYTGFSLGGRAGDKQLSCDNTGCHNILKDIEIWEFSIVKKPANQLAIIDKIKKDEPVTSNTENITKFVRPCGSKWCVYSHTGKILGHHDTKESAERQLRAIEANKSIVKVIDSILTTIRKFRVEEKNPTKMETGHFRVYVDKPEDAPEDAEVKQGARGRLYYIAERKRMFRPKRKKEETPKHPKVEEKKPKEEFETPEIAHQTTNIESERGLPTKKPVHKPQRITGTPKFTRRKV